MKKWVATVLVALGMIGCAGDDPVDSPEDDVESTGQDQAAITSAKGTLPTFQAMSAAEVDALRKAAASNPGAKQVDALDSKGQPALYYALVEVRTVHEAGVLDELGIYHDSLPLFDEDWTARVATKAPADAWVRPSQDETGAWLYALVPGVVYNQLQAYAAAGKPVLPNVVLQPIPTVLAQDVDPTRVSYSWLQGRQFSWTVGEDLVPLPSAADLAKTNFADAQNLRALVDAIVPAVQKDVATVKSLANAAPVALSRVDVKVTLKVRNSDPFFSDANGQLLMRQGWGKKLGQAIDLGGTKITAKQSGLNADGQLDVNNQAHVSVKKNTAVSWCVHLSSNGAMVTETFLLIPDKVCTLTSPSGSASFVYGANTQQTLETDDSRTAILAQATDGYNYLRDTVGQAPKKARILVGQRANDVALGKVPFAPCGSYYGSHVTAALVAILFPFGVPGLGLLPELTLGHIDLVINEPFEGTRGVVAHEYGHFALCSLLSERAPARFESAWTNVLVETLGPQLHGGHRGIQHDASWLNEGFADFFGAQLVGGVNYFDPSGSIEPDPSALVPFHYCDASSNGCLEVNRAFAPFPANPPTPVDDTEHNDAAGAFTTLLLDAFDGHPRPTFPTSVNRPSNSGVWDITSPAQTLVDFPIVSPRQNDEVARLPGSALLTFADKWALEAPLNADLTKENVFVALAKTMKAHGLNDSQACRTIAIHSPPSAASPGGDCAQLLPGNNLGLNPALTALELGDLVAPQVLTCTANQAQGTVVCDWEDVSIDATGSTFVFQDATTNAILATSAFAYSIVNHRTFALPAGFSGPARISIRTTKGARISNAASYQLFVPPPLCGDGVVNGTEACDGDTITLTTCGNAACPAGCPNNKCIVTDVCAQDCQSNSVFCDCAASP